MNNESLQNTSQCPTCGVEFKNNKGMKIHHAQAHDSSIDSDEMLLAEIRRLATQLGRPPTSKDMDAEGQFTCVKYDRRFGSWNMALREAEFQVFRERNIPQSKLVAELQAVTDQLDRSPTRDEMDELGAYSSTTYARRFGSWNDAVREAGCKRSQKEIKEELINAIQDLAENIDAVPRCKDMDEKGAVESYTICSHFGSWNGGIRAAGFEPHKPRDRYRTECANCGTQIEQTKFQWECDKTTYCGRKCVQDHYRGPNHPHWQGGKVQSYGPNWSEQRSRALERDQYRCQGCGMRQSEHQERYGAELHVHHIQPIRSFKPILSDKMYENINRLGNLVSLCSPCHRRWEQIPVRPQLVKNEAFTS